MTTKIPFALKDDQMVDVQQVESGKACGCTCPSCKEPLQARKGEKLAYHFAHLPGSNVECDFAPQIAVHNMAKQLFAEEKHMLLPELKVTNRYVYPASIVTVCKQSALTFDSVTLHNERDLLLPDAKAEKNGKALYFEFLINKSTLSSTKQAYFRDNMLASLTIDLTGFLKGGEFSKSHLRNLVVEELKNKTWVYHPNYKEVLLSFKTKPVKPVKKQSVERKSTEPPAQRKSFLSVDEQFEHNLKLGKLKSSSTLPSPVPSAPIPVKPAEIEEPTHRKRPKVQKFEHVKTFRCETCFHIFEVEKDNVRKQIVCPNCQSEVSQNVIKMDPSKNKFGC